MDRGKLVAQHWTSQFTLEANSCAILYCLYFNKKMDKKMILHSLNRKINLIVMIKGKIA